MLRGPQNQPALPDEGGDEASMGRTGAHVSQHEDDVAYVTENRKRIMGQRTMSKWEKILKVAVNAEAADQTFVEGELLRLGILAAHWRELEVQTNSERGEWVIINVNAGTEHHCVLLKPRSKMMSKRNGHIVCPGEKNGLCAFTAALHITKAGGALDASNPSVGKLARRELDNIKRITSITNVRQFTALLQTAARHEQIAAHMYRSEKAAGRKAAQLGGEPKEVERSAWLTGHEVSFNARDHVTELELSPHHTLGVSTAM
jgi:hypothetical protein